MEMLTPNISGFGHDKSLTLRPYAQLPADKRPTLFYAGDGVSDLSAARETDLLFAKKGHGKSIDFYPHVHHHHSCPPRRFHFSKRERTKEKINSLTNPHQTDLITYCARENVPFTVFEDWSSILATVKKIVAGEQSVQEAAHQGFEDFKAGKAGV